LKGLTVEMSKVENLALCWAARPRNLFAKQLFDTYMKNIAQIITFTVLASLLVGCSKHSLDSSQLVMFVPDKPSQVAVPPIPAPAGRSSADIPADCIHLSGIELSQALSLYANLADAQLLIEPRLQSLHVSIAFNNLQDLTRIEGVRLFEEVLHKQAGLVFEHQDARHIAIRLETNSVTK
jgi:hypothetical protein